jgi:uncharacterized protein YdhG (YjbR/CyaY superfamily)
MDRQKVTTVDEYIQLFPSEFQVKLTHMRSFILHEFPFLDEKISYNMPACFHGKPVCYFAGYSKHIGFYPTAAPIVAFQEKLASYKTSKGAVQFPLDQDLPLTLIKEMIQFRLGGM